MRKMMMTFAAVLCCALTTSVFTACNYIDTPVPEPVIVTDDMPFPYDVYIDTSVRPGDDFFRYQYGGWLDGTELSLIYESYFKLIDLEKSVFVDSNDPIVAAVHQLSEEVGKDNNDMQLLKDRIDYLSSVKTQQQLLKHSLQNSQKH